MLSKRTEVAEFDPLNRSSYLSRYEDGMTEHAWISFESIGDGTLVSPFAEVELPGVPQGQALEFTKQRKSAVRMLLGNLKRLLEAAPTPSS